MVRSYFEKHHNNSIPNPYKYGKGNKIWWQDIGLDRFWGYHDNGTWITDPPPPVQQ